MKKRVGALVLSLVLILSGFTFIYADDTNIPAYDLSLVRLNAAYEYLDEMYLDTNLGMYIEYATQKDIDTLQRLSNDITTGCTTDEEKCVAIWTWMRQNVKIAFGSYAPIDVFRTMTGVCSGHSQLMSSLMKLAGVKSTIVRGYLLNTNTTSLSTIYNGISEGHQWVMAYYNNDWYLFDDLWGECGNNNREQIAAKYYTVNVDGISAYTEAIDTTKDEFNYTQTVYKDGDFIGIRNGNITNESSANFSMGGCLRYCKTYYWNKGWEAYYAPLEGQVNNQVGYALKGGFYTYNNSVFFVKENGITLGSKTINYNNDLLFVNGATSVKIDESIDNNGLTDGNLNMYVGEVIDLSSLYNSNVVAISMNKNIATTSGLQIRANSVGTASVRIVDGNCKVSLNINVYGDARTSSQIFKDYCDHSETHIGTDNCEYCDYCGEHFEKVVNTPVSNSVVEQPIEVIEPPTQEPVIETPVEIIEPVQEPVEQEIIKEPVIETPVEEIIEETPIERPVQEVIETPTEELVQEPVVEIPEVIEEEPVEEPQNIFEQLIETIQEIFIPTVEEPTEEVVEGPIQEVIEEPTEEVVEEPIIEEPIKKVVEEAPVSNFIANIFSKIFVISSNNEMPIEEVETTEEVEVIEVETIIEEQEIIEDEPVVDEVIVEKIAIEIIEDTVEIVEEEISDNTEDIIEVVELDFASVRDVSNTIVKVEEPSREVTTHIKPLIPNFIFRFNRFNIRNRFNVLPTLTIPTFRSVLLVR